MQTQTHTYTHSDRHAQRHRETQTHRRTHTHTEMETPIHIDIQTQVHTQTHTHTHTQTHRDTHTDTQTHTHTETHTGGLDQLFICGPSPRSPGFQLFAEIGERGEEHWGPPHSSRRAEAAAEQDGPGTAVLDEEEEGAVGTEPGHGPQG